MVLANVVLPDPGLSSIRILPSDIIAASANFIFSLFQIIDLEMLLISVSNINLLYYKKL